MLIRLFLSCFLLWSCAPAGAESEQNPVPVPLVKAGVPVLLPAVADSQLIDTSGHTLSNRVLPPPGFRRVNYPAGSFGYYLQNFPLKPAGSKVYLFDGREKYRQNVHVAVLDIDVGTRDLQQCADAVMRLRAEYLYGQQRYDDIHFNFNNGFRAEYARWRSGERIRVTGSEVSWVGGATASTAYSGFRRYLTMVFAFAGTWSLSREMQPRDLAQIEVGDVFIQGGSPGHAVIVMDKAVNETTGAVRILLAQSYMPAQDIHILNNPLEDDISPWYAIENIDEELITPEWRFKADDLKRF